MVKNKLLRVFRKKQKKERERLLFLTPKLIRFDSNAYLAVEYFWGGLIRFVD